MARKWITRSLTCQEETDGVLLEVGKSYILKRGLTYQLDVHIAQGEDHYKDDTFTLMTDDDDGGAYKKTVALGGSTGLTAISPGVLRVTFTDVLPQRPYALLVDPGQGPSGETMDPYYAFREVLLPYAKEGEVGYAPTANLTGGQELEEEYEEPEGALALEDAEEEEEEDHLLGGWAGDEEGDL